MLTSLGVAEMEAMVQWPLSRSKSLHQMVV